jgi:hypothetical protein
MGHATQMRRQSLKSITAFGLLFALAACGGGGGGSDGTPVTVPAPGLPAAPPVTSPVASPVTSPAANPSAAQMRSAQASLLSDYTSPTIYTAISSVPQSGSAVYDGYVTGQLANRSDTVTDTLLGQLRMTVGFTNSSVIVTGAARNFIDDDNVALSGSLDLSNGSLDRAGSPSNDATLLISANGTLRDAQGRNLVIGTQFEGDFLGTSRGAVGGEVLGSVTVNGIDQDFDGGFIAER